MRKMQEQGIKPESQESEMYFGLQCTSHLRRRRLMGKRPYDRGPWYLGLVDSVIGLVLLRLILGSR